MHRWCRDIMAEKDVSTVSWTHIHSWKCWMQYACLKGQQPAELSRTRSYHYSQYNLAHFIDIFLMSAKLGYDIDGSTSDDGRNFHNALGFLIPYISDTAGSSLQTVSSYCSKASGPEHYCSILHQSSWKRLRS